MIRALSALKALRSLHVWAHRPCGEGDVFVVAPDGPHSGMGHAITIEATIRCDKVIIDKKAGGVVPYLPLPELSKKKGSSAQ